MKITKVEIYNFRSHLATAVELNDTNILIGVNNSGKTSFLDAINLVIGYPNRGRTITEEDFFADKQDFNPQTAKPIKIVLEFRENYEEKNRFPADIEIPFEGIIQDDESLVPDGEQPIRFIRLVFQAYYNREKSYIDAERYFEDSNGDRIDKRNSNPTKQRDSWYPAFYLQTVREFAKEVKSRTSFLGRIKNTIDYSEKTDVLSQLFEDIETILFTGNITFEQLRNKIEELKNSIRFGTRNEIKFQAFEKDNWRLLNNLALYLNSGNSNINLPLEKHGMGTQNVAILLILEAYLEIVLPKEIENEYTTPILCIEEPEAHLHPNAQRALFRQIIKMNGQKILSTHSTIYGE